MDVPARKNSRDISKAHERVGVAERDSQFCDESTDGSDNQSSNSEDGNDEGDGEKLDEDAKPHVEDL